MTDEQKHYICPDHPQLLADNAALKRRLEEAERMLREVKMQAGNGTSNRHALSPGLRDEIDAALRSEPGEVRDGQ